MATNVPFPAFPYPHDTRPPKREKEMKVLCLGMSRTGTMSLYTALTTLGYNCYHTTEACLHYRNNSLIKWNDLINYKYRQIGLKPTRASFKNLLAGYDALADIPAILFPNELMDLYPDANIILTVRDEYSGGGLQGWVKSMQRSYFAVLAMKRLKFLAFFDNHYLRPALDMLQVALEIFSDGQPNDSERLIAGYTAHNAYVRGQAQKRGRKVLVYNVRQGWGPLCRFLGKEIPMNQDGEVVEFPWKSQGDFMRGLHYLVGWWRGAVFVAMILGILGGYAVLRGVVWWVFLPRW
ncbi:hypothetical protein BDV06DRAFT_213228 [Aspergillus oleicola]